MRETKRDMEIKEFLSKSYATTSVLCDLFFNGSLRAGQSRLQKLYENDYLMRKRAFVSQEFAYWSGSRRNIKSSHLAHRLMITETFSKIKQLEGIDILNYDFEFSFHEIVADIRMEVMYCGKKFVLLVECEYSKYFDTTKYDNFYNKYVENPSEYYPYFMRYPSIIAVTDRTIPPSKVPDNKVSNRIVNIHENYDNINDIRQHLSGFFKNQLSVNVPKK